MKFAALLFVSALAAGCGSPDDVDQVAEPLCEAQADAGAGLVVAARKFARPDAGAPRADLQAAKRTGALAGPLARCVR